MLRGTAALGMIVCAMTTPPRCEFTVDRLRVQIFPDRAAMGAAAGSDGAAEIARVIAEKGNARVILASAPSQSELLTALTSAHGVDWSRVTLFHMDVHRDRFAESGELP